MGAADGEVLPDGAADVDDSEGEADGVDELGGALLVPEESGWARRRPASAARQPPSSSKVRS